MTPQGAQISSRVGGPDNLAQLFSGQASENFFYFDAQRLNVGRGPWESPERLLSNARNLPTVLAHLQGARRPVFDLIERLAIDVLGGIDRITVARRQNDDEILIWPERSATYEELAFGLNESGTGVGQLLAIITALVTSDQAVMVIDEINSFLHPAAVKKLINLLRSEYSHHQYIISTHSADVIGSCNAEKIYIVKREGFKSTVSSISLKEARDAKEVSSILGFSMMDVFGHERLVWVEGPTEEVCFPYIARRSDLLSRSEIGFAPVFATDAFSGRSASRSATEVYESAGKRLAPLLKGMAFALDRERLSDGEVARLERSRRKLRFLPRRCFECYLIHVPSIIEVLEELDGRPVNRDAVAEALMAGREDRFGASRQWNGDLMNAAWLKRVDAAKLLEHVFSSVTEKRVEYRKTRDGISLLKKIAEQSPDSLSELEDFVKKIVEIALRDTPP
ncbi:AAA family ATPase [Sphingomonas panacisoli]|uniref:AAA family ATPase n=1 Tax=Sphingomonas panacisoli TaxID=1813879 RepID=A0A5B8LJW3_9SPHN|nr:AAA family ATPase [Sphingomonas panacisoli]QDZ08493.1 AAA family ATPase [Sphingomonas panacisoli]